MNGTTQKVHQRRIVTLGGAADELRKMGLPVSARTLRAKAPTARWASKWGARWFVDLDRLLEDIVPGSDR